MKKPVITVVIGGPAGAGKTTLAQYIAADLKIRHGVDVKLIDDNHEQLLPTSTIGLHANFNPQVVIDVEQK
jgi:deoxyadenosine/deoxycytidine kinase